MTPRWKVGERPAPRGHPPLEFATFQSRPSWARDDYQFPARQSQLEEKTKVETGRTKLLGHKRGFKFRISLHDRP
jgi:hypothetical protein